MTASAYGETSNSSCSATPANGQPVMLRTALPQASRVVSPTSAISDSASSASFSLTKWSWMFWRVVTCPTPLPAHFSATSANVSSCLTFAKPYGSFTRIMKTPSWRWP